MTKIEQEKVLQLRRDGLGYKEISLETGISINTVKSYCRRHPALAEETDSGDVCRQCGAKLKHTPHRRKKTFCSDACRMAWWNAHPELVQRKAFYRLTCVHCGVEFVSYGNAKRKYCSRACYSKARMKVVEK